MPGLGEYFGRVDENIWPLEKNLGREKHKAGEETGYGDLIPGRDAERTFSMNSGTLERFSYILRESAGSSLMLKTVKLIKSGSNSP